MSPKRISSPKITSPSIQEVLPRHRLFRLLDKNRKRPIIWITGPAGSGKTTLIASYLAHRQLPSLWYQLDKGDSELATFFYYLGLAVKKASSKRKSSLPLFTPEYLQDIPTFTMRYFEKLYPLLKIPSVIVFDNYQDVTVESMLHDVIYNGLIGIPEGITIIFCSREDPPPSMVRLLATNTLEFIDWKQLRFTLDESKGIIKLHNENILSEKTVQQMHQVTQGWAAGLILLLLRSRREGVEFQQLNPHSLTEIFDYFAIEIFKKIDKSRKEFLLKTAFFPQMTPKMAECQTANYQASSVLSELYSKNCFIEKRYDHPKIIYQYHPLFKDFLITRAKDELSATNISQLQYKAASLLEASGQIEDAAELYYTAGGWKNLEQLILKHAQLLVQKGRNQTLERWINALPEQTRNTSPWLCYWMGTCLMIVKPLDAIKYFEKAYKIFKQEKNSDGLFLSWSNIVDCYIHEHTKMPLLEPWIKELKELFHLYPHFSSPEIEARVTFSMFIALIYYLPKDPVDPPISVWAEKAEMFLEHMPDVNQQIMISNFLIYYYCLKGDLSKAALLLERLKQKENDKNISPFTLIIFRLIEATYCCFIGDFTSCQKLVERGIDTAKRFGVHMYTPHLLAFGVDGALASSDHATAKRYLQRMAEYLSKYENKLYAAEYEYLVSWRLWLKDNPARSLEHLKRSLPVAQESKEAIGMLMCHLGLAHVLTECGKHSQAVFHLTQAQKIIARGDNNAARYKWLLIKAQLSLKKSNEEQGLTYLQKALLLGREKEFIFIDFFHPSVMARLCVKALEAGIEVEHVQVLIRKLNLVPNKPPIDYEKWPWPIKIFTLGRFSILKDGDPLHFPLKVQKKPLQMLKVLISLGSRNLTEVKISDLLWPLSDGDMAHLSFTTTLHRLRKLLGYEEAIQRLDEKLSLDTGHCWVDAIAFQRAITQADTAWERADKEKAVRLLKKAVALYHGPFLVHEEMPWTILTRDQLRSKYIRAIEKLGYFFQETGDIQSAIEYLTRGIEVDGLAEQFYQHLMLCLKQDSRKAEAISVYHRCKKNLTRLLGTHPSPQTESIYRSLLEN